MSQLTEKQKQELDKVAMRNYSTGNTRRFRQTMQDEAWIGMIPEPLPPPHPGSKPQ